MSVDTSTTAGKIAVMAHSDSGGRVEMAFRSDIKAGRTDVWQPISAPGWMWGECIYRIAPEPPAPKVVPWTFESAPVQRLRVRRKGSGRLAVVAVFPDGPLIGFGRCDRYNNEEPTWEELAEKWEQLDGSPCGEVQP